MLVVSFYTYIKLAETRDITRAMPCLKKLLNWKLAQKKNHVVTYLVFFRHNYTVNGWNIVDINFF